MHTQRGSVWTSPLVRRSTVKRCFTHLHRAVLSGLYLPFGQLFGFFFHTWPALESSPTCMHKFFPRKIPAQSSMGSHISITYYGMVTSKEPFCICEISHLPQGGGTCDLLILTQTRFSPSLFLPYCYLKDPTGNKSWLFTLFLLLLPFWSRNRRLVVNI